MDTPKTPFDHVDEICLGKKKNYFDTLSEEEKKSYNKYMVNRILSMNVHQLPLVDLVQRYSIPSEQHYLLYRYVIPRGKQWNKYIKKQKDVSEKYEQWLIDLVAKHYEVSKVEAITYLDIYYAKDKLGLRELCEKYAIDSKQLKKAKL